MPLYTYRCNQCGHEFEVRQRMVDDALKVCPVCGGDIRRVVSSVGVVFKGSGFYVTDNRSSSVNGGGSSKSSSSKSSDSGTESTSTRSSASNESGGKSETKGNSPESKSSSSDSASSG